MSSNLCYSVGRSEHWLGHKNLETTMIYLGMADIRGCEGRSTRRSGIEVGSRSSRQLERTGYKPDSRGAY
jgi:hypothetical protein